MVLEISAARGRCAFSVRLHLGTLARSRAENARGKIGERHDDWNDNAVDGVSIFNDGIARCINMIFEIVVIRIV